MVLLFGAKMFISGHICEIGIQTQLSSFHSEIRSKLARTMGTWGSLVKNSVPCFVL